MVITVLNSSSSITLTNYYPKLHFYVRCISPFKFSHDLQRVCHQFYSHHHGETHQSSWQNIYQCKLYRERGADHAHDFVATGDVSHQFGTFISNGYKVDYGLGLNANYSNLLTLNYTGTDTIRAKAYYTLSASANTTLTIWKCGHKRSIQPIQMSLLPLMVG